MWTQLKSYIEEWARQKACRRNVAVEKRKLHIAKVLLAVLAVLAIVLVSYQTTSPAIAAQTGLATSAQQQWQYAPEPDEARTPLQRGLLTAIEERRELGLPVPSVELEEYDILTVSEHYIELRGNTTLHFDNPEQAGLDKWPDFMVEDNMPPGAVGFVSPGDYSQAIRDAVEERFPGIWEEYEFGYEPRTYVFEEIFRITFPEESSQAFAATSTTISNSITLEEILMGFTYPGPNIDYTVEWCQEVLWFEVWRAKAGFALDWGLGLRLPVEVSLTTPDLMTQGSSYSLISAITPLDWSEADFQEAGVPETEGGNEFVLRYNYFMGVKAWLLGFQVIDWAWDMDFDGSRSFTTPFGPGEYFPIPILELYPEDTGLEFGCCGVSLGIGLQIDPNLGSEKITAKWQAVPGSDASGSGEITYDIPGTPVSFGPVTAGDFGSSDYAHIRLDEFRYWFTEFLIDLNGWLQFKFLGWPLKIADFDIAEFDLSGLTGGMWLDVHDGTDGSVDASVLVIAGPTPTPTAPQLWYLDSETTSAGYEMEKDTSLGNDGQTGSVDIAAGSSVVWLADQAAVCDVTFSGGAWVIEIRTASDWGTQGDKCEPNVGGWDTTSGWYDIPTTTQGKITWDGGQNILVIELQADPATIFQGDYLALEIKNNDSVSHLVNTDGRSSMRSPDTDPGYPVAEVVSGILLGLGLVGLAGYAGWKRRKASSDV